MQNEDLQQTIKQIKEFTQMWNELYAAKRFDDMKELATEDVGIANVQASTHASGLIFGRDAYKKGICDAYYGTSGKEQNILVMEYEGWEYIPLDKNSFYTIGRYSLQPNIIGVNCWLLNRKSPEHDWKISRVINN